ncbi:hypothetical protein AMECASPLE_033652, partial [Ameca splendens]
APPLCKHSEPVWSLEEHIFTELNNLIWSDVPYRPSLLLCDHAVKVLVPQRISDGGLVTSHCFLHDFWSLLFQESSKTVISRKPPTVAANSSYVYFSSLPARSPTLSIQFPPGSWTFTIVIQVRSALDSTDLFSSSLHQDNFSPQSSTFNLRTTPQNRTTEAP